MLPDPRDRRVTGRVRLIDASGRPLAGATAAVEQTAHAFGFGNIGFDFVEWIGGAPESPDGREIEFFGGALQPDPERLAADFLELFNTVTLPFYWRGYEPQRGRTDGARLRRTAEWFGERGVTVKGHPLVWHTLTPPWLLALDDDEAEAALRSRIRDIVTGFAGVINLWDAINEAVILPVFTAEANAVTRLAQRKGRLGMIALAFEEARAANPAARLVLNDFDLSESYERLIAECLDAGIEIDALGLQTHMHQGYRGEEQVWEVMERFARFGLPLQLTETTLLSGDLMPPHIEDLNDYVVDEWPSTPEGEARQADEIVRHYRTVFAHPAVESLTYWGITDHGSWLGAPVGLLRADGSRKPAFDALRGLIRGEWWLAATPVTADADGVVEVMGYPGTYRVDVGQDAVEVALTEDAGTVDVVAERARRRGTTTGR
ncbi:endo-1,4-beta-xylanase [Microbacterium sp. zg.Y909]|uniref:endo-1,4-beta-xylanase n=1 Tax=Microbacterium sp. zg.Y909 TaxID=2969413 RepID=UPI00214B73E4|nr:endo-1,4-beta-xylanase [Microbacterium sp. zg.Y909]MCR2825890.1 endo-1,4-beta-xylanase [Microbacterium sp. zg.Y909]